MESNEKLEELLKKMYAKESLHDDIDTSDIIDEEWTKFEATHFSGKRKEASGKRLSFFKIAAMFISILMLGGIAYATIHYISGGTQKEQQATTALANSTLYTLHSTPTAQDSTVQQHYVYEDAELKDILRELATYYHFETVYKNEEVKHVRLYFTWNMTATLDELIETFNKFERFHISRDNQRLIVE